MFEKRTQCKLWSNKGNKVLSKIKKQVDIVHNDIKHTILLPKSNNNFSPLPLPQDDLFSLKILVKIDYFLCFFTLKNCCARKTPDMFTNEK